MFAFDDWKQNINEYCTKYSRVVFSVYHSESFSLAQKADCVFVFGGLEVFQFFCLTKSCHLTLLLTSSLPLPPGCLDRLFICPAWARKGYCESKRRLMQKHCPSSCDFCYGKKQQGNGSRSPGGRKKKEDRESFLSIEQHKELLWTVCQWSNGSQQVQPCRAALEVFKGLICREITLGTGRVCVLLLESGSVSERSHSRAATCWLLAQWGLLYTSVTHQTTASVGLL